MVTAKTLLTEQDVRDDERSETVELQVRNLADLKKIYDKHTRPKVSHNRRIII